MTDLLPGVRNLIMYANIAPDEQVLLATGIQVDPLVTGAIREVLGELSIELTQVVVANPGPLFHEPPPPVVEAMLAADTVIDVGAHLWGHTWATFVSMTEYLTKGILVAPPVGPEIFTSRAATFPRDLLYAIQLRLFETLQQPDGTRIRVTSPNGTDLLGEVWQNRTGQGWGSIAGLMPGDFLVWPPGVVGFLPPKGLDGIAVFESYVGLGKTTQPVQYVIERQRIVETKGGPEADQIRVMIADAKHGDYVAEIMFGVNPASRVDLTQRPVSLEAERSPQTLHIGIGDEKLAGSTLRAVRSDGTTFHLDGMMIYPTLEVGTSLVLDHGRLPFLEEKGFRALAAEFGDPDELLAYPPVRGY